MDDTENNIMKSDDETIYGYDQLKHILNEIESFHRNKDHKKALKTLWKFESVFNELGRELESLMWDTSYRKTAEDILPIMISTFPGSSIETFSEREKTFPGKNITMYHNLTLSLIVLILNKRKYHYDGTIHIEIEVIGMDNDDNVLPIELYFYFHTENSENEEAKNTFESFQVGKCKTINVDSSSIFDFTDDSEIKHFNFFSPAFRSAEPEEISPDFLKILINEIHDEDLFIEDKTSGGQTYYKEYKKEELF